MALDDELIGKIKAALALAGGAAAGPEKVKDPAAELEKQLRELLRAVEEGKNNRKAGRHADVAGEPDPNVKQAQVNIKSASEILKAVQASKSSGRAGDL